MNYVHGQVQLYPKTSRKCIGSRSTWHISISYDLGETTVALIMIYLFGVMAN